MGDTEDLPKSKSIKTLFKFDPEYSADSVEWCPHDPYKNFAVCGTYYLQDTGNSATNQRFGRVFLLSINSDAGLEVQQKIDISAVLDQKWCPNKIDNTSLLGIVTANKTLDIFALENGKLVPYTLYTFVDNHSETLILSLDWSTGKYHSNKPFITCSDSHGNIHLLQLVNEQLVLIKTWHGHDYEAWIAGFYYWDTNVIFSGGDDTILHKFDTRCDKNPVETCKNHTMGVTSFNSNSIREYTVVSGSYDEHIRLWDVRSVKSPVNSIKMPGPLWRLKWDPFCQQFILAACMNGGFHIVKAANTSSLEIVESYYEHKSIAYGADWSFMDKNDVEAFENSGNVILGTCSFYDHLMCVSKTHCDFNL